MLTDYFESIIDATDEPQASRAFFLALAELGFENALYMARFHVPLPSAVIRDQTAIHASFAPTLTAEMTHAGWQAPWAEWTLQHRGDAALASMHPALQTGDVAQAADMPAVAALIRAGLTAGRVVSMHEPALRSQGFVLLLSAAGTSHDGAEALWQQTWRNARSLCWTVHMKVTELRQLSLKDELTPRQRQVLEWSSAGKTVSEIATIIGVTPATVEKHLRLAREVLGADTTAHAVLKAYISQQIFPNEENKPG